MKKAPPVRLSLRKLLVATLAVGPVAILPAPLWAAVPTASDYVVTNGSVTLDASATVATFNASNRSVIAWDPTKFNVEAGTTWNFNLPAGGAILNKVGYQQIANGGPAATKDNAVINGTLFSNGTVFVLANGNISVGAGAALQTTGGLVLSTLAETNDFNFTSGGNLSFTGAATGDIVINSLNVAGSLQAYTGAFGTGNISATTASGSTATADLTPASPTLGQITAISTPTNPGVAYPANSNIPVTITGGGTPTTVAVAHGVTDANGVITSVVIDNPGAGYTSNPNVSFATNSNSVVAGQISGGSVSGDLLLKAVTAASGINITSGGALSVGGNFSVTTNNGAITQTNAVTVGGNETRLNSGTAGITLQSNTNDFKTVFITTSGGTGDVSITDNNIIVLGTSAVGNDLNVLSRGSGTGGDVAISTNGTLTIGGDAFFTQTATANSNVTIANNSTVAGTLGGSLHGNSALSFNGLGNVRIGTISSPSGSGRNSSVSITTNGTITLDAAGSISRTGNGTSGGSITLTGANIVQDGTLTAAGGGVVTLNATSGGITLNNNINVAATGSGNVVLRTAGGAIQQTGTSIITTGNATGTSSINATTSGTVSLNNANNFAGGTTLQVTAGTATINTTGSTGSLVIGTTNTTGGFTVTANGVNNTGVVLGTGAGTAGQNITVGGSLNVNVAGAGTITDGDYSAFNVFGSVNLNNTNAGGGAITLDAARINGSLAPSVRLGQVNVNAPGSAVSVAETGTLNLGAITAASLAAYSTAENIINSGTITTTTSTAATVGANGTIDLNGASNAYTALTLSGGTNVSANSGAPSVVVNVASPAPGNATFTSNSGSNIVLGAINAGNLTVTSGGIIDIQGAVVAGNATLTAGASTAAAVAPTVAATSARPNQSVFVSPATVSIDGTADTVTGVTISNLDLLSYATAPTVNIVGTNTTQATASATLGTDGRLNGATVTAGAGYTDAASAYDVYLVGGTVTANITQSFDTTAGPTLGSIPGSLSVSGTTTINSPAFLPGKNDFGSVALGNVTGQVAIADVNNLSISGNATSLVTAIAGANSTAAPAPIAAQWGITLGNLNVSGPNGALTVTASNGGSGESGTITQAQGSSLHVENTLIATTGDADIVIGNTGNSAGRVQLFAGSGGSGGSVTYVEDGTVKLGNLTGRNNSTITSRFGSIIEDPNANDVITSNGTLTLNAPAGSVTIGNTTHTTGTTTGNITAVVINAPSGAASVITNNNISLGNVVANSLTVTASNNITQSQPVRVFGAVNLTAGRNITMTNNSNNFGPVSVATTGVSDADTIRGNISITESGTLNLRSVSMGTRGGTTTNAAAGNATFTARSVSGDIIDTGLGGVKLGGLVAPSTAQNANAILTGSGIVTLTASNGNIVIDDPTSDVLTTAGVAFNAKDITLAVLGSTGSVLVLGANNTTSSASGNLTARSALGNIGNAGALSVGGIATLETGNGNISINQPNVGFGQLRFTGNQVSIQESGNMDILTGSSAFGPAQLVSGGSITVVPGTGSVTFGNNVSMQASTDILLRQTQVVGTLTLSHGGTANLSALSKSTDLNSRDPVDLGTGPGPATDASLAPKP